MSRIATTVFVSTLAGLLLAAAPSVAQDAGGELDLFTTVGRQSATLQAQQAQHLQAIEGRPYAASVSLARVERPQALQKGASLALPAAVEVRAPAASRRKLIEREDSFTWIGQVPDGPGGEPGQVFLVVDGQNVTGRIQTAEGTYTINPLGEGLHAVTRLDLSAMATCALTGAAREDSFPPLRHAREDRSAAHGET